MTKATPKKEGEGSGSGSASSTVLTASTANTEDESNVQSTTQYANEADRVSARIEYLDRKRKQRPLTVAERDELRLLRNTHVPHLLLRSYHLPGYTYWEDLGQYLCNNHPVFGLCCRHKFHPIGFKIRFISLIGSLLFGLTVTNVIYLIFAASNKYDYNHTYFQYNADYTTGDAYLDQNVASLQVTNGNLALWTIGAALNALYDTVIYEASACSCFMEPGVSRHRIERYQKRGVYIVILFAVIAAITAIVTVILREEMEFDFGVTNSTTTTNATTTTTTSNSNNDGDENVTWDWSFIISYFVEMVLNYFFYYPLIAVITFTGVIGCFGRVKFMGSLGGRPYEMRIELEENEWYNKQLSAVMNGAGSGALDGEVAAPESAPVNEKKDDGEKTVLSMGSTHLSSSSSHIPFTKHQFRTKAMSKSSLDSASSHDLRSAFAQQLSMSSHHGHASLSRSLSSGSLDLELDIDGDGKATITKSDPKLRVPEIRRGKKKNAAKKTNALLSAGSGHKGSGHGKKASSVKSSSRHSDDVERGLATRDMSVLMECENEASSHHFRPNDSFGNDSFAIDEEEESGPITNSRLQEVANSIESIQHSSSLKK